MSVWLHLPLVSTPPLASYKATPPPAYSSTLKPDPALLNPNPRILNPKDP